MRIHTYVADGLADGQVQQKLQGHTKKNILRVRKYFCFLTSLFFVHTVRIVDKDLVWFCVISVRLQPILFQQYVPYNCSSSAPNPLSPSVCFCVNSYSNSYCFVAYRTNTKLQNKYFYSGFNASCTKYLYCVLYFCLFFMNSSIYIYCIGFPFCRLIQCSVRWQSGQQGTLQRAFTQEFNNFSLCLALSTN